MPPYNSQNMFKKFLDFFKNFFSFLNPKQTTTTPTTTTKLPEVDNTEPQDGADVSPESTVVVINEEEPIIDEGVLNPFDQPGDIIEPEEELTPEAETTEETSTTEESSPPPPITTTPEKEETTVVPKTKGRYLWCLDNGHGNKTAGKRSPVLSNGKRFFEYEFNRDIVKRITIGLDKKGINYFVVVPEIDIDNFLAGRVARANSKKSELPKIFLSVHSNAGPASSLNSYSTASGIETWYFHGSSRGRKLASYFQKELIGKLHWKNRNIRSKAKKQFYVLRNTSMPAVLTENGFYNNKKEVALLNRADIRQKIADAHIEAISKIEKKGI